MLARPNLNILLAEDNPVNQRMALIVLKKLGLKADTAKNGREVLVALQVHHYDLCSWISRCRKWMELKPPK